jgi:TPR repeat protein
MVALFKAFSIALVVLWSFASPVAAEPDASLVAAVASAQRLAEQGDERGQWTLGTYYEEGVGVPQSYAEALKWYRLAAERGYDRGQFSLGVMYNEGKGVPQDCIRAHMWFNLAAAQGGGLARQWRDALAKKMSGAQIAEAQKLAHDWKAAK